ncbi:MAG TPA: TonB-dependent receptor [Candidatus Acidoferrum sp.]|nr:TonB-dependent receptor [Candidatus Acidoferrum sp.]
MVRSKMGQNAYFLTVLMLVFVTRLFAQGGGSAAITGTVLDPSGAVVSGAQVTVTQAATSVKRSTTTNASGAFTISSLPPANYSVTIEAPGFKTLKQDITLLADQIRTIDARLELGQASQEVTVEAAAVMVNTVTPVLSQVIEQTRVVSIPLTTRNAADLTLLVPGTTNANGHGVQQGDTKQIAVGTRSVAESIAVNGARPDQISYNLDGANNEDLMSNTNNPFPFPDALQEFSVQTNSFDSRYGTNAGAVVNVVTKSGTNEWHGSGFEFVRNKVFNAKNFFAKPPAGSTDARDPLKQNQFGATIGGPIRRNKSFIFFGYQATRIRTVNNSSNAKVPTTANMTGDFSSLCKSGFDGSGVCLDRDAGGNVIDQIYNPATGAPFAGNKGLPVDPVAQKFAALLPVSSADVNGNVTFQTPLVQNLNEYVARFDQVVRGKDRLFVRFYLDRFQHAAPFDGKDVLTVAAGSTVQSQNYAVGYTSISGTNFVNNVVIDVVREASDRGQGGKVPQMTDFGATIFQLPQSEGGIRSFSVSNFFSIGNFTDAKFIRNTGDIRDDASWTHGKHTFSFGGNFERDQSNIRNTDLENGSWSFTTDTAHPAGTIVNPAQAAANFVLGHMRAFSQTSGDYSDSRQNVIGIYFQDQWKFRPRLSLTVGLRWEPQSVMKEVYGRTEQFRPDAYAAGIHSTVIPTAPAGLFFVGDSFGGIGFPPTGQTGDLNNFAPRAGFAYDIFGTGKTVIRGGGGVFYSSRLPGLFLNDASISQPFSLRIDLTEPGSANSLIPLDNPLASDATGFAAGFPQRFILSNVPKNVTFHPPVSVFGLEPGRKWVTPTIYDWNLTVERQLRPDTVLHLSYVGLRGTHLREDADLNPRGVGVGTEASRPFQGFSDILENQNNGMSNFNAFEIDIEKRPAGTAGILRNLTLLANYTYSKAMDIALASNGGTTDVGSSKGSGVPYGNPLQPGFETGPSDFDHRHRVVASIVWDLPKQNGKSSLQRWTLGGWQWSSVFTVVSGDALTILSGQDRSKTNLGGDRGQFIGSTSQYGGVAPVSARSGCPNTPGDICVPWLDTALFTQPAVGTFGNVGKGIFRGPTNWNMDLGLHKTFYPLSSHENLSVQLRGEFFNVFNHTQLNATASSNTVTVSSSNFGSIRSANDPRIIQLALKVSF